jgi:CubicO group peptidase (beta-lactamase class C family)
MTWTTIALLGLAGFQATVLGDDKSKTKKDPTVVEGELGKDLDRAVTEKAKEFWGAVLVARQGKVVLAKGYGFQDYKETPNTPVSLFEIASTSKQFTAAAILKLESEGKLKTTDSITRFFTDIPADKKKITVHHLLTHTSGLVGGGGLSYASTVDRDGAVKEWLKDPLDFQPGEKFQYSNRGYGLLAAVVEVASGKTFEEYMKSKIFDPAGLTDTGFVKGEGFDVKRVTVRKSDETPGTASDWFWGWGYRGMGGVVTTVYDLLKWDRALRTEKILKKSSLEKYYTPEKETGHFSAKYACGWEVETTPRKTTRVFHTGGVAGYKCQIIRYLDEDAVIIVLTNDKNEPVGIAEELSRIVFAK